MGTDVHTEQLVCSQTTEGHVFFSSVINRRVYLLSKQKELRHSLFNKPICKPLSFQSLQF